MLLRRLSTKVDIPAQLAAIKAAHVPELPVEATIGLPWQSFAKKPDPQKSPLVMIHGLFGAKQNYSSVGRKIASATGRDVIGLDMRNHGAAAHVLPHDYKHMAQDTVSYLESLGRKVVLAGHSMGAKVSMLVALQRPELVEKLVVIDNSPVAQGLGDQFTSDLVGMCAAEQLNGTSSWMADVDRVLARYEPDPLVRVFLASNVVRPKKRSGGEKVHFRLPVKNFVKHDVLGAMGRWPTELVQGLTYPGPVVVMRGLRSGFVSDDNLKDFEKYFSDITTVDYDCGHWLVSEEPDKFVRETVEFVER